MVFGACRRRDRLQRRPPATRHRARRATRTAWTSCPTAWTRIASAPTRSSARGAARASASRPTRRCVFAAGRLVRKKGFEYLIDALAAIPQEMDVQAAIAGAGDLEAELRAARREPRASAIACASWAISRRTRSRPGSPPPTSSRFPRCATTAGTSTACRTSCSRRWRPAHRSSPPRPAASARSCRPGRQASSCPSATRRSLAEAILVLARDPELRVRLGEAARASVMARFGWEFVAGRFEAAYERALAMSKDRPITCSVCPCRRPHCGRLGSDLDVLVPARSDPRQSEKIEI